MKQTFFLFLIIFFSSQLNAQTKLSAEEAVAIGIRNNYDLQLLRNDSAAYALDKAYANAAFYPRLNASAGLIFNNNNQRQVFADTVRAKNGVLSNQLTGSVNLNWTIFSGFRLIAAKNKINEYVALGDLNVKNQVLNTSADILNKYYAIVYAKEQLTAIDEQIVINEERKKLAEKKLQVGLGAKPELLQATVDLNAQLAAKLQQQNNISNFKEQLNQLINVNISTAYDVADTLLLSDEILLTDVLNMATAKNPTLLLIKKNIDITNLALKERRAERYPTVNFLSAYNYSRNNNTTVVNPFSPLLSTNNGFNYGLGVSIPIFNNYTVKKAILQTKLDLEYLDISLKKRQSEIELGIYNSFKTYQLQQNVLKLEQENIGLAKENVAISLQRFRSGLGIYLELREAQKSLEDANRRLFAAQYNTLVAEIELKKLKGDLNFGN